MRDDEEFNIIFVLVVEKYPVLYNYKLQTYSNRNVKEVAWQKVASELKCTAEECKKRWRLLRISLLRHLRENKKPSGSSAKKKKPFYLEDAMKYLIPFTKSRHQTGTADDEDEVCENDSQLEDIQTVNYDKESVNDSDVPQNNIEYEYEIEDSQENIRPCTSDFLETSTVSSVSKNLSKSTPLSSKKRRGNENWENAAVQCLTALTDKYNSNTKKKESFEDEDSDLLFLKSLLPDLKKLNDAQKRLLFDEIINEVTQVPLSSPYSSAVSVSFYDNILHYSTDNN